MKKIQFLAIWSMLLFFSSCKDKELVTLEAKYDSTGIIYGLDVANCACCGNWVIAIDGSEESVQFLELPQDSNIDLENAVFPLEVALNWKVDESSFCSFILIEDIRLN